VKKSDFRIKPTLATQDVNIKVCFRSVSRQRVHEAAGFGMRHPVGRPLTQPPTPYTHHAQTPRVVMQSEIIQLPKIVFKKETVYDTKTIVKPTLTMTVSR